MPEFQVNMSVEVDQVGNGLCIRTPVSLEIAFDNGRWAARAFEPAFQVPALDTFDAAIIAGARQATVELQAAVIDRPLIAGRITPEEISAMF